MGWANRVTVLRGILVLVIWVLVCVAAQSTGSTLWAVAFILFVLVAAGDGLDGYLARKFQEESVFGRIMDPLVDKLMTIGTMVVFLGVPETHSLMPAWVVAVLLLRELTVTSLRSAVEGTGRSFQAVAIGKYKTVMQCIATGALFSQHLLGFFFWGHAAVPGFEELPAPLFRFDLAHAIIWVTLVITVISGVVYAQRAKALLSQTDA